MTRILCQTWGQNSCIPSKCQNETSIPMLPLAAVQLPREMICQCGWVKWFFVKSSAACMSVWGKGLATAFCLWTLTEATLPFMFSFPNMENHCFWVWGWLSLFFINACFSLSFCITCVPYTQLCVCAHTMHTTCAYVCPALAVTGITFYLVWWQQQISVMEGRWWLFRSPRGKGIHGVNRKWEQGLCSAALLQHKSICRRNLNRLLLMPSSCKQWCIQ